METALPLDRLVAQLELSDTLYAGRGTMIDPQDLPGRYGRVIHAKASDVNVDIMPEGATPGTPSHPAPTTIPHPSRLGAIGTRLTYIDLPGLVELKLAAGRARDESDVVELLRANLDQIDAVRKHLFNVNDRYAARFQELLERVREQTDR
jgi:hypothetical protein